MSKGIKVQALRHHTFAGKDYEPGDSYVVNGDAHQTEDQYLDTLRAVGFVRTAADEGTGPNIVDEVGDPNQAPAKASTAVKPMSTEDLAPKPEQAPAEPKKAAAKSAAKPRARAAKAAKKR